MQGPYKKDGAEKCSTTGWANGKTNKAWALTNKFKCEGNPSQYNDRRRGANAKQLHNFPLNSQWRGTHVHNCGVEGQQRRANVEPFVLNAAGFYNKCGPPGGDGNYIVGSPDGDALYTLLDEAYTTRVDFSNQCLTPAEKQNENIDGTIAAAHKRRWLYAKAARDTCVSTPENAKRWNEYEADKENKAALDAENERKKLARETAQQQVAEKEKEEMAKLLMQRKKNEFLAAPGGHSVSTESGFGYGPKVSKTVAEWDAEIAAKQIEIDVEDTKVRSTTLETEMKQLKEERNNLKKAMEDVQADWNDAHGTSAGFEPLSDIEAYKAVSQRSRISRPSEKGTSLEELFKTIDNDITIITQDCDKNKIFWAGENGPRDILMEMLLNDIDANTFKLKFCIPSDGDVERHVRGELDIMGISEEHIKEYLKKRSTTVVEWDALIAAKQIEIDSATDSGAEQQLKTDMEQLEEERGKAAEEDVESNCFHNQLSLNIEIAPYDFFALILTDLDAVTNVGFSDIGFDLRNSLINFMDACRGARDKFTREYFKKVLFDPLITKLRKEGYKRRARADLWSEGLGRGIFNNPYNSDGASSNDEGSYVPVVPVESLAHTIAAKQFRGTVVQCLSHPEKAANNPVIQLLMQINAQAEEVGVDEKFFHDALSLFQYLNEQLDKKIDYNEVAAAEWKKVEVDDRFLSTMEEGGAKVGVRGKEKTDLNLSAVNLKKTLKNLPNRTVDKFARPENLTLADLINFYYDHPNGDKRSIIVKEIIRVLCNKFNNGGILLMKFAESHQMSGDTSTLLNTITPELLHAMLRLLLLHGKNLSKLITDVESCLTALKKKQGGRRKRKKTRRKNKKRKKTRRKGKKHKKTRRNTNKKRKKTRQMRKKKNRKSKKNNRHRKTKRN